MNELITVLSYTERGLQLKAVVDCLTNELEFIDRNLQDLRAILRTMHLTVKNPNIDDVVPLLWIQMSRIIFKIQDIEYQAMIKRQWLENAKYEVYHKCKDIQGLLPVCISKSDELRKHLPYDEHMLADHLRELFNTPSVHTHSHEPPSVV